MPTSIKKARSSQTRERVTDGGIAHEAFEAEIEAGGLHRTKRPSDHRPVWIELGTPLDA
jgi:hypothetical protein